MFLLQININSLFAEVCKMNSLFDKQKAECFGEAF